jgi:hypothetical protein
MLSIGGSENSLPLLANGFSLPIVDHNRCEQVQADVVVLIVVPVKEGTCPGTRILHTV